MTPEEKIQKLHVLPFFQHLSSLELAELALHFQYKKLKSNTIFIHQGDSAETIYFLISGAARVYVLSEEGVIINVGLMGKGDIIGEISFIDNSPRSATVETIKDAEILCIPGEKFMEILETHGEIAIQLLKIFAHRLKYNNEVLEEIQSQSLVTRTWKTIQTLQKLFPDGNIPLSHEELASITGATRARISESLQLLQKEGKITLSHKRISVL